MEGERYRPSLRSSQPLHPLSPARPRRSRRSPSSWLNLTERNAAMSLLNITKVHDEPDYLGFVAHPLANMFPMIEGNAFEELKRDIAAQGILEPIRLYQGMILDGRNRYAAGKAVGHSFSVEDFVQWEGSLAEAEAW